MRKKKRISITIRSAGRRVLNKTLKSGPGPGFPWLLGRLLITKRTITASPITAMIQAPRLHNFPAKRMREREVEGNMMVFLLLKELFSPGLPSQIIHALVSFILIHGAFLPDNL